MNCEQCEQSIYPYLDGELSSSEREAFEEALERCEHCRELLLQAENIRAAMMVGADGPSLPDVRREAILAAAHDKVGGAPNDKPEEDNVLPFPFRAVGLGLAAAVFATAVFGFWLLQSDWERPEFDRMTGEQSSVAQIEAEHNAANDEQAARSGSEETEESEGTTASVDTGTEEGEPPPDLNGARAQEPVRSEPTEQATPQSADREEARAPSPPNEAETTRRNVARSAESDESPSPLAQRRARSEVERVQREAARSETSAGAVAEYDSDSANRGSQTADREIEALEGQSEGSSDSFGTSTDDNNRSRPSESRAESTGSVGSGGSAPSVAQSQESEPSEPARSAVGAESEAASGLAAEEETAGLAEADEEASQEPRPTQETFAVIRSHIEAGEYQLAIDLGLAVEGSRNLSASEKAELFYLVATAYQRRGDQTNARRFFEQAVEFGSDSPFGRAAYQELQELGD